MHVCMPLPPMGSHARQPVCMNALTILVCAGVLRQCPGSTPTLQGFPARHSRAGCYLCACTCRIASGMPPSSCLPDMWGRAAGRAVTWPTGLTRVLAKTHTRPPCLSSRPLRYQPQGLGFSRCVVWCRCVASHGALHAAQASERTLLTGGLGRVRTLEGRRAEVMRSTIDAFLQCYRSAPAPACLLKALLLLCDGTCVIAAAQGMSAFHQPGLVELAGCLARCPFTLCMAGVTAEHDSNACQALHGMTGRLSS